MAPRNVALLGATGNLGAPIFTALSTSPDITLFVLARPSSSIFTSQVPSSVTLIPTPDFSDTAFLTSTFKKHSIETIVSPAHRGLLDLQPLIIDAAIAAGVQRFIPSEFGSDLENKINWTLPIYAEKVKTRKYLVEKAKEGKIEWTAVQNGIFFDWGLKMGFLAIDPRAKTAKLFDGGDTVFSTTLLSDIGKAVTSIAVSPVGTYKNQAVYINSVATTQNKLLRIYEKLTGEKFTTTVVKTEGLLDSGLVKMQSGDVMGGLIDIHTVTCFGKENEGDFTGRERSEELGIKKLGDQELEALIKELM